MAVLSHQIEIVPRAGYEWHDRVVVDLSHRPPLTPNRIRLAYATAVATDAAQLLLGPLGWAFADEILDIVATIVNWRLLGFHPLLLPTFALEFLPMADMLP